MKSRNEIDFLRLLERCQSIANKNSWRLEKYVDALSESLDKLRNQKVNHLTRDTLEEYGRKIQYLRGLIETEKLPSAEKRLLAAELLTPPDKESKADHLVMTNKYHNQMRQELLLSGNRRRGFGGNGNSSSSGAGHDGSVTSSSNNKDGRQQQRTKDDDNDVMHEDITQNLLELTNNIRESMHAANAIIQKDTETLSRVAGGADTVSLKMQRNSDRLGEFVRKGCQFAIWIALILVTCTFLMMVVFIRLFPKPTTNSLVAL